MSDKSTIEWTDASWNPTRGCTKVSPGCKHCYAETFAERFKGVPGHPYELGFAPRTAPDKLAEPLKWKKPRRIFVNSMSDLFHESFSDEYIAAVFGVMAACPQHTFQVLTKRAERMARWFALDADHATWCGETAARMTGDSFASFSFGAGGPWPLPNVWLGVSVEDQQRADERIPHLLRTPAAVRFLSCEPLLGPVDLRQVKWPNKGEHRVDVLRFGYWSIPGRVGVDGFVNHSDMHDDFGKPIDWCIVGGESGPGARPCAIESIRDIVRQCKAAGVACFVKQLGSKVLAVDGNTYSLAHKGGDWSKWAEDLRVREFPGSDG